MMHFDLTGKIAVVTGAAQGIGKRIAQVLAEHGADLALIDLSRQQEKLETTAREISQVTDMKCFCSYCDLRDASNIPAVVEEIVKEYGRIDILVNNAGVVVVKEVFEVSGEDWNRVLDVDLRAAFIMTKEVGKIMAKNHYGRVINIASIAAKVVGYNQSSYYAAKAGVYSLTKSLAVDLGKFNITVNAIGPGLFDTGILGENVKRTPYQLHYRTKVLFGRRGQLGTLGDSGDLDGAVIYFAADETSYTTGQILYVDGGLTNYC